MVVDVDCHLHTRSLTTVQNLSTSLISFPELRLVSVRFEVVRQANRISQRPVPSSVIAPARSFDLRNAISRQVDRAVLGEEFARMENIQHHEHRQYRQSVEDIVIRFVQRKMAPSALEVLDRAVDTADQNQHATGI